MEFLLEQEAADRIRVSPRTLQRLRMSGQGPAFIKVGRRVLYSTEELDRYAAANTYQSTAEAQAGSRTAA